MNADRTPRALAGIHPRNAHRIQRVREGLDPMNANRVGQPDRLQDGEQLVIAVRSLAQHFETEVDLGRSANRDRHLHGAIGWRLTERLAQRRSGSRSRWRPRRGR